MKQITFLALLLIGSAVISSVAAQTQHQKAVPSLLYEVSGKGIKKPSYIFGTFHAVCPGDTVPLATLDTYVGQTDQMMMEVDMDDAAEMQLMTMGIVIPDGKTLKDFLTPEQYTKVDEMVRNFLGYSVENVKMVKPMILSVLVLISPKVIGCTPTALDHSLMQNAVAKKKPVVGLETVASQVKAIDSKPLEKQATELYEVARNPQKAVDEFKSLMAAYKLRDPDKLFELSDSMMTDDKEFQTRLLDDRNMAWIPKLEIAFKEKPTFVAVGAGHLGGKNGLIALLRAKGYEVKPVKL